MSELDQILEPIAGSNPSGADLEYDSRFQAVQNLIETGNEENPTDWKKVKKECLELLADGRSVEFLVLLAVSLVATEGYRGMHDGLRVLTKSVKEFWENIYPELDMEEPESDRYLMRLNSIAQLGEKPGKLGDKLCYVEKILRSPISINNPRVAISFWPVWESELSGSEDSSETNAVMSYVGQMPFEEKKMITGLVDESIKNLQELSSFLMEKTGSAYNGPFDECLLPTLDRISKVLSVNEAEQAQVEPGSNAIEGDLPMNQNAGNVVSPTSPPPPPPPPPGTINSREDVKKALEKIIDYYKKNEPSSPIPYLAERTQELVDSDFMGIIQNLSKESEQQFKKVLNLK